MSDLTTLLVIVALCLTVLAFTVKSQLFHGAMIHGAALIVWLITTILLVFKAIDTYPGVYDPATISIPTAIGLFGVTMILIHLVSILLPYLRGRTSEADTYNARQEGYKQMIAQKTRRRKKDIWS